MGTFLRFMPKEYIIVCRNRDMVQCGSFNFYVVKFSCMLDSWNTDIIQSILNAQVIGSTLREVACLCMCAVA